MSQSSLPGQHETCPVLSCPLGGPHCQEAAPSWPPRCLPQRPVSSSILQPPHLIIVQDKALGYTSLCNGGVERLSELHVAWMVIWKAGRGHAAFLQGPLKPSAKPLDHGTCHHLALHGLHQSSHVFHHVFLCHLFP